MTEHTPDLDERLARLAARKATGATVARTTPTGTAGVPPTGPDAAGPVARGTRSRRRHPAAAGRILSVGLSSSAFLSIVAAFGAQPTASAAASGAVASAPPASARPVPRPKVVVTEVHHPVYVDQWGRPIPAAALPKSVKATPTSTNPAAGAGPFHPGGSSSSGPPAPSSPSLIPAAPGGSAGGSASPTAPAPAPAPGNPNPPAPTLAPVHVSPPPTSPPATVVTIPPPPPPPACSGTKCP